MYLQIKISLWRHWTRFSDWELRVGWGGSVYADDNTSLPFGEMYNE